MTNWPALMTRKTVLAYLDMGDALRGAGGSGGAF